MADNYYLDFPFIFSKLNIAGGFWRLVVLHLQAWDFYYVRPGSDVWTVYLGETEFVAPTALQMGWWKSPPFFCSVSETARGIISDLVKDNTTPPWHKFEGVMIPTYLHPNMAEKPVDIIEVFVNDFIGATNNSDLTHLLNLSHYMLHGIHAIFPPSDTT